jgi:hypothetical protein
MVKPVYSSVKTLKPVIQLSMMPTEGSSTDSTPGPKRVKDLAGIFGHSSLTEPRSVLPTKPAAAQRFTNLARALKASEVNHPLSVISDFNFGVYKQRFVPRKLTREETPKAILTRAVIQ